MHPVRNAVLCIAVSLLAGARAEAGTDCGCGPAQKPCEASAFQTVPEELPLSAQSSTTDMSFSITHCWDCSGSDLVGAYLFALMLLPFIIVIQRVRRQHSALIISRLHLLSVRAGHA